MIRRASTRLWFMVVWYELHKGKKQKSLLCPPLILTSDLHPWSSEACSRELHSVPYIEILLFWWSEGRWFRPHAKLYLSKIQNPKLLLMSGWRLAWQSPPSVYECVCVGECDKCCKSLWAVSRLAWAAGRGELDSVTQVTDARCSHTVKADGQGFPGDDKCEDGNHIVTTVLLLHVCIHPNVNLKKSVYVCIYVCE